MKQLLKFLLAVVVLFTYSCTTDTTEDLGIGLNNGQVTEFAVSLEESRTQLGEKAGEVYPLYWSEGDKISVNGVESSALTANQAGSAVTSFTIAGALKTPYCIAYPAAPAGQVLFAEKQMHTSNTTFASGVSTMYAYSEELAAQMNHLTGVLKIGVTGSAKLTLAQISTIDRKPIAGAFDLDFASGKATATEASKEIIEYSFGEGVTLSSEPTYLHIAVPAGLYTELYVTLYDTEGGVMYATVKSDSEKPLVAGKVREFSNAISYAATDKVFVVKDAASLKAFAAQAATLDKDVLFVADVDLTGEAWTPIEGYAGTIRGNGYSIKGLTAPFFGSSNATIRGLHLTDVNIVENTLPIVGAFARSLVATDTVAPIVEHCSASGKITVNCTEYEPIAGSHITIDVAGVVGYGLGVSFFDCKSDVELDVKQVAKSGNTISTIACIGGICGFTYTHKRSDDSVVLCEFVNCENTAAISVVERSFTEEFSVEGSGIFSPIAVWIGGICSSDYSSSGQPNTGARAENLVNRGDITASVYSADCFVGGVMGNSYATTRENWKNYGDITLKESKTSRTFLAGVAGCTQASILNKAANYGEVKATAAIGRNVNIGGVIALSKGTISNSENHGVLNIDHSVFERSSTYVEYKEYAVGGVIGSSTNKVLDCTNTSTGVINVAGHIFNGNPSTGYNGIGGIIGIVGKLKDIKDIIKRSTNEANITVAATTSKVASDTTENQALHIGGAIGSNLTANYNDVTISNSGDVLIASGNYGGPLHVGGLVGYTSTRIGGSNGNPSINSGNVTICDTDNTLTCQTSVRLGGCIGISDDWVVDLSNTGTVTINSGATFETGWLLAGGCIGSPSLATGEKAENTVRCSNSGAINIDGTMKARVVVGGVSGQVRGPNMTDCQNSGIITLKSSLEATSAEANCVGGITGIFASSGLGLKRSINSGNIVVEKGAKFTAETRIGGVCGLPDSGNLVDLTNTGDINISGTFSGRLCVGGALGYSSCTVGSSDIGCHTSGDITITSDVSSTQLILGGVAGLIKGAIRNSSNTGNIEIASSHNAMVRVGGIIGWVDAGGVNTVANSGNITVKSTAKFTTSPVQLAGGIGINTKTTTKLINTGTITVENGAEIITDAMIGGCIADARDNCSTVINTGDIVLMHDIPDGNTYYVGGAFGKMPAKSIKDIQCYATITKGKSANFGFISATPRDATHKIVGGGIGGKFIKEWDDSDGELVAKTTSITDSNFYNYIYGGSTDWTGVDDYDGCEYLTSKPEVTVPWPDPAQ